jgi:hypothetical protein
MMAENLMTAGVVLLAAIAGPTLPPEQHNFLWSVAGTMLGCVAMAQLVHAAATWRVKASRVLPAMVFGIVGAPYVIGEAPRPPGIEEWHWSFIASITAAGGVYAGIAALPKSASAKVQYLQTLIEAFLGRRPTSGKGGGNGDA